MKRSNLSWIHNRDAHVQRMSPIRFMSRVEAEEKLVLFFFKPEQMLGAKIMPPRTPH